MPLFHEEQQFRQAWLWMLFAAVTVPLLALLGLALHQQLILGEPVGSRPVSDLQLVAVFASVALLHAAVIALFWFARLVVTVDSDGVRIRFSPFHLRPRLIPFGAITSVRTRPYSALDPWGGWGVRLGLTGWTYSVSGDEAVELILRSGRRIVIGTRRSAELEAVLRVALRIAA